MIFGGDTSSPLYLCGPSSRLLLLEAFGLNLSNASNDHHSPPMGLIAAGWPLPSHWKDELNERRIGGKVSVNVGKG